MAIIRTIEGTPVDYTPGVYSESFGGGRIGVDPSGATKTRGAVLTDEGGYRNNFSGTSLYLDIGTCTFANGSVVVTGTGFAVNNDIRVGDFVKLTSDGEPTLGRVFRIIDDNNIELYANYTGSSATAAGSTAKLVPVVGAGCSYVVGSGVLSASSGTISGGVFELEREADYNPIIKQTAFSVSQRIPNQTIYAGLYDNSHANPQYWCWFKLTGTDNSVVTCESAFSKNSTPSSYEIETSNVKLPSALNTGISLRYRIESLVDKVRFLINGNIVAEHFKSIPNPYSILTSTIRIVNSGTIGTSTTLNVDFDSIQNFNKVMMAPINDTDPTPATTNDMETIVDLLTLLVSKTSFPDTLGRVRTVSEVTASTLVTAASNWSSNIAQWGGQAAVGGNGIVTAGAPRIAIAGDGMYFGPSTSVGAPLPIIYNNIVVTA